MNYYIKWGAAFLTGILLLIPATGQAQDLTTARDVLEANIEATGGRTAWEGITDMHIQQEMVMEMQQMGVIVIATESWLVEPGFMYSTVSLQEGPPQVPAAALERRVYKTPEGGWVESANGRQDMSELSAAEQATMGRASAKNELDLLEKADSTLALLPDDEFDGTAAYVVQSTLEDGTPLKFFYDKDSFLLIGQEVATEMGQTQIQIGDYREVNGVLFSFETVVDLGPTGSQTIQVTDLEVNAGYTAEDIAEIAGESDN